ncbi:MAG: hypothetical protein BRD46_00105 [Bacteroidetes bacterium QS_8_68_15]|nr:MAG: hypothetical protein BRD46_00105 [Bacteroidetes bacterium QS_8_68_15]
MQPGRSDSGDAPVTSGEAVRVTGQVRRFAGAASERDADQDVNIDYKDDDSALVARTGTRSSASSGREP